MAGPTTSWAPGEIERLRAQRQLVEGPFTVVWDGYECFIANRHGNRIAKVGHFNYTDSGGRIHARAEYPHDRTILSEMIVGALNTRKPQKPVEDGLRDGAPWPE